MSFSVRVLLVTCDCGSREGWGDHWGPWGTMGNHGGPWGTVGDRGNQLEPAGTLESQPGVLDDGMQNSALGCMISRLYQCFSFVAREFCPRNDQTPHKVVSSASPTYVLLVVTPDACKEFRSYSSTSTYRM